MLAKIQLQAIPNQQITFGINNQTFNMSIFSRTINSKTLRGQTPDADKNTKIYTFASIFLGTEPVIENTICKHAVYINQYTSNMVGYLFFYVTNGTIGTNDDVIYTGFNNTINLYYSDYDFLALDYENWVKANSPTLQLEYIYGVSN